MGDRATVRMVSGDKESQEGIYLHFGGSYIGRILMEAENARAGDDPDACLAAFETAAKRQGWEPHREPKDELLGSGAEYDTGDFVIDVSAPKWRVDTLTGHGLRGDASYYYDNVPFEVAHDPNGVDEYGHHHLFNAVNEGDERLVDALLAAGADPNAIEADQGGKTPLHTSVYTHNPSLAIRLLEAGAQPDIQDRHGKTASDHARASHSPIAEIIDTWDRQRQLSEVAQAARPQTDLASPEEALALRRSRGRCM